MANAASNDSLRIRIASGINLLAGLWLVAYLSRARGSGGGRATVEPGHPRHPHRADGRLSHRPTVRDPRDGMMNVLLGLWLIVSPFLWGYHTFAPGHMWNSVIPGVVVVAAGTWSALSGGRAREV